VKVAFITGRVPYPLNTGGRIRTFHLLKEISHVHRVTLLTAVETAEEESALAALRERIPNLGVRAVKVPPRRAPIRKIARAIWNPMDPLPYTWAAFRHSRFSDNVHSALRETQYDLLHCDHIQVAYALLGVDAPPRLINEHNIEHILIGRLAEHAPDTLRRAAILWQARKTRVSELRTLAAFQRCVVVSDVDRLEIGRMLPGLPVTVVPNGVDVATFTVRSGTYSPYLMVFTGAMDWRPNIDGIAWFVSEALPRIRQRIPQADLVVVGRNPSGALIRKLGASGVTFTGTVEDVRPYMERAALIVVPLRVGGGTRLKILEAWAMGKPVLSTSIGAEGLPAIDGRNIALADTAEELAEEAARLLNEPEAAARLGTAGRNVVEDRFAWERIAEQLLGAYESTVSDGLSRDRVVVNRARASGSGWR
jgi:glycosyltransferase involved in cell wall biosynthesis